MKPRWCTSLPMLLLLIGSAPSARSADRIVLRNLDIIGDRTVAGLDADGVRLDDGQIIGWDAIEQGRVAAENQAEFDRLLDALGEPLYRIRQRLSVGDVRGLLEHAEAVYPSFVGRRSKTAYMVCQSLMWSRLAHGQREAAVEPYLRCFDYLRSVPADQIELPGDRRLAFDVQTGMTPELPPLWFNASAAQAALPGVFKAVAEMQVPRPEGTRIYFGTLCLAAGDRDRERGLQVLDGLQGDHPELLQLRDIAAAQGEVAAHSPGPALGRLSANLRGLSPQNRPLATYWLGMANLQSQDDKVRDLGVLLLLRLPALYGQSLPDLAAAGLYQCMQTFQNRGEADSVSAVRKELLAKYPQTYHAALVKQELSPNQDP